MLALASLLLNNITEESTSDLIIRHAVKIWSKQREHLVFSYALLEEILERKYEIPQIKSHNFNSIVYYRPSLKHSQ